MQPGISPEHRQAAKREMIKQIEQGVWVQQAKLHRAVPMHRATVYRLLKRVQCEGENAFVDGRHGHPVKRGGAIQTFLIEQCQAPPSLASSALQPSIQEHFGLSISISQLNRVRASLKWSRQPVLREKKAQNGPVD